MACLTVRLLTPKPTLSEIVVFKMMFTRVHRWLGLAVLAFLTIAGPTGAVIVFTPELDHWLNEDAIVMSVQNGQRMAFSELAHQVERQYPGARVTGFVASGDANDAPLLTLKSAGPLTVDEVWVDPYSGAVRGGRLHGKAQLDRRHVMPFLHRLHRSLMLGATGTAFLGVVACGWLLLVIAGVYLALYRRGVRTALTVARGSSVFRTLFDLHRALGLLFSVVMVTISVAAMYLSVPTPFKAVVSLFSTAPEVPIKRMASVAQMPVRFSVEQAVEAGMQQFSGSHLTAVTLHPDKGVYQVRMRVNGDINSDKGTGRVLVSTDNGRIVSRYSFRDTVSTGETFLAWMLPLHSGKALGDAGRVLVALTGVLMPAIGWTGFWFWYRRRRLSAQRGTPRVKPA